MLVVASNQSAGNLDFNLAIHLAVQRYRSETARRGEIFTKLISSGISITKNRDPMDSIE